MRHIIEKANEIREKYGIDDLELLASKLGAEVMEIPLGKIIKEVYIKDEGVIVIDPNLHPYKKRHLIAHGLAHHLFHRNTKVNYFLDERDDRFNYWKQRRQEKCQKHEKGLNNLFYFSDISFASFYTLGKTFFRCKMGESII
jgi:Zn-dependent peptidase ImmA (M78 family)